jgi:hypothetical protein
MLNRVQKGTLVRSEATEVANHVKGPCKHEWLNKSLISPICCADDRTLKVQEFRNRPGVAQRVQEV